MSDIADDSDERIQREVTAGIERARQFKRQHLPMGKCWYCDEPVGVQHLFCDKACSEDFEIEERSRKRAGIP